MNLFIDSNVVLDFFLERQPFFEDAKKVFALRANPNCHLFVSAASMTDIHYIAYRTLKDRDAVMNLIERSLSVVEISAVNSEHIHYAVKLHWKDFEDAVQYSVAKFNNMDAIVTRNMKGFKDSELKILTPEEIFEFIKSREEIK